MIHLFIRLRLTKYDAFIISLMCPPHTQHATQSILIV